MYVQNLYASDMRDARVQQEEATMRRSVKARM
jgi:hypothetical protein